METAIVKTERKLHKPGKFLLFLYTSNYPQSTTSQPPPHTNRCSIDPQHHQKNHEKGRKGTGKEGEGEEKGNAGPSQPVLEGMGRVPATTSIQYSPPKPSDHPHPQKL